LRTLCRLKTTGTRTFDGSVRVPVTFVEKNVRKPRVLLAER